MSDRDILAIEAEAAPPPLDGLDVERLARADFEVHELRRNNEKWADLPEDGYKEWWRDHARGIHAALREGDTTTHTVETITGTSTPRLP